MFVYMLCVYCVCVCVSVNLSSPLVAAREGDLTASSGQSSSSRSNGSDAIRSGGGAWSQADIVFASSICFSDTLMTVSTSTIQ